MITYADVNFLNDKICDLKQRGIIGEHSHGYYLSQIDLVEHLLTDMYDKLTYIEEQYEDLLQRRRDEHVYNEIKKYLEESRNK